MSPSTTQIGPGTFVELSYTLYDEDGDVIEKAEPTAPLSYVHGYGQIIPGLERQVEGMSAGQQREITVPSGEGYGDHDPEGVFEVDRSDFPNPENIKINDEFVAEGADGMNVPMRVLDILDDTFVVDTNHPLAGQRLRFEVTVSAVRPATAEEIAQAEADLEEHDHDHDGCDHDHGDGGHSHGHGAGELVQLSGKPRSPPS